MCECRRSLQLLGPVCIERIMERRRLMSVPVREMKLLTGWQNIGDLWYWCFW